MLVVLAWLWPLGIGGRMPVGGDVTQFSIGLMAFLKEALREGRLPTWNDRWGFGFPGIGESQMGVYYPPHWLLYGTLSLEAAYTWSLVLHTLWGSLGASWAARRFGASPWGSALSGVAWSTCGFALIHLSHQWAATTGCWMPWAWGLAWMILQGQGTTRCALALAVVLTMQMLPGHFQLAFITQVGLLGLVMLRFAEALRARGQGSRTVVWTALGFGAAFPLAAAQLWPTLRLARLAASRRDFEYLSGFAATPFHLITFVAPGLFERSPLWRPIVWDPFHTSPEEYLGYVGLVPLFLAVYAVLRVGRSSPAIRALVVVGLLTTWLALGPYVPGFAWISTWPGFSFFRAPARWMLAVSLVLSLLAGLGFDALATSTKPQRAILGFAVAVVAWVAVTIGAVEVLTADERSPLASSFVPVAARGMDALPWGEPRLQEQIRNEARRPNMDARVFEAWARQGVELRDAPRPIFLDLRWGIYRQELQSTAVVLLAMVVLGIGLRTRSAGLALVLWGLAALDLLEAGTHRRIDQGPIAPLTQQSPVLGRLAALPRGTRTLDSLRNLPMVAGASNVSSYRTLDLPVLDDLIFLSLQTPRTPAERETIERARRLTGASVRIEDPGQTESAAAESPASEAVLVEDPALAGWKMGEDWVRQLGPRATRYRMGTVSNGGVRAWLVPLTPSAREAILERAGASAFDVIEQLKGVVPVPCDVLAPDRRRLSVRTEGPGLLILSELADPQWSGVWTQGSSTTPAKVQRAFGRPGLGAWMAVEVPGAGDWSIELRYRADDVSIGLGISSITALSLLGLFLVAGRRRVTALGSTAE